jgi:hypothetical protein
MKMLTPTLLLADGIVLAIDIVPLPTTLPEAMITAKVVNESEVPLAGVQVNVVFDKLIPFKDIESVAACKVTDEAGEVTFRGRAAGQRVGGTAEAPGYYRSSFASPLLQSGADKKWNPWNPTIKVVLKEVKQPIPMYAKKLRTEIPVVDVPVAFDLIEGDWVAPHGRGKNSDLIFALTRRFENARDYESSLSISFSSATDGILPWDATADYHSALKLPRIAPESGYAQPLTLSNKRLPGSFVERDVKEERNYFFRIRTVLDEDGKVVSAQYGKIDGDIRFSPIGSKTCSLMFTYYCNPEPNGRNMEFDPKSNLLKGLKNGERVAAP